MFSGGNVTLLQTDGESFCACMWKHRVNTVPPHAHICAAVPGECGALEAVLVTWSSEERTVLQETSADQFSFLELEKEAIQTGGVTTASSTGRMKWIRSACEIQHLHYWDFLH